MKKTRVLVIDDNKNIVKMVKDFFEENEDIKIVLEANDGEEGIRIIDKKKDEFDLIILDLVMPRKDGMCVLEHMKEKHIDKKVIVLTSYNTPDIIRKVTEMGINYFMLKPFELVDLEKKIINVMTDINYSGETSEVFD